MENKKQTISANEINKYTYCPYQFYYERYYGTSNLRQMYRARNEALDLHDNISSNFVKGQKFHNEFFRKDKLFRNLKIVLFVASLVLGVLAGILYYIYF